MRNEKQIPDDWHRGCGGACGRRSPGPSGQLLVGHGGDPGNAADTGGTVGAGSVGYTYQIGQYDVTIAQYTAFLNAVASSDPYGLYNSTMDQYVSYGGETVIQTGSPGSYTYSYGTTSRHSFDNGTLPMFNVSWGEAARFANWMGNGQPTNLGEAAGSTETGAYTLNGDTTAYSKREYRGDLRPPLAERVVQGGVLQRFGQQRHLLDLSDAEQHLAGQHAIHDRDE